MLQEWKKASPKPKTNDHRRAIDQKALDAWNQAIIKIKQANDQLVEQAKALDETAYESLKNEAALQLTEPCRAEGPRHHPGDDEGDRQAG